MSKNRRQRIGSLEKAFKVLEAFGPTTPELKLGELATATGLTESSVQRLTFTLRVLGYLKVETRGVYALSHRALNLTFAYMRFNHLLQVASPHVVRLASDSGLRADLVVLDDIEVVYMVRVPSRVEAFSISPMGRRWPALSSASGRAILSRMEEPVVADIFRRTEIPHATSRTVRNKREIRKRIRDARDVGYAFQIGEVVEGAASIAAPIIGATGQPIAAISLGATVPELEDETTRRELAGLVLGVAQGLSSMTISL